MDYERLFNEYYDKIYVYIFFRVGNYHDKKYRVGVGDFFRDADFGK